MSRETSVRVDIARLSQWAHEGIKGKTNGGRALAVAELLSAAVRMSLALEAIEQNEASVLTVVREHCCEDPACACHRRVGP